MQLLWPRADCSPVAVAKDWRPSALNYPTSEPCGTTAVIGNLPSPTTHYYYHEIVVSTGL